MSKVQDDKEQSSEELGSQDYLFEQQGEAPAPSQSYYHVVVTSSDVVLRTWPKKRLSQTWTRDGALNPSSEKVSHAEFINGDLNDQITLIFGDQTLQKIINITKSSK